MSTDQKVPDRKEPENNLRRLNPDIFGDDPDLELDGKIQKPGRPPKPAARNMIPVHLGIEPERKVRFQSDGKFMEFRFSRKRRLR
jgi:hypothetical protein